MQKKIGDMGKGEKFRLPESKFDHVYTLEDDGRTNKNIYATAKTGGIRSDEGTYSGVGITLYYTEIVEAVEGSSK